VTRPPVFPVRIIGIAGTIGAIIYCGWFFRYFFFDVGGSWEGVKDIGLGPTVIGLGAVGLIFCLVLAFKLTRLFGTPRSPGPGGPRRPGPSSPDDGDFDPDAVIARYMERRAVAAEPAASPRAADHRPSAAPSGFGRRAR
jgi:hypothetical protein